MVDLVTIVVLALAWPARGAASEKGRAERPRLELRATPHTSFSPVEIVALGRLVGGDDQADFYCPAFEWDWGDGTRSVRESDCPPFDEETKMARLFSLGHRYQEAGEFQVKLTLRRAGRAVAVATASIRVLGRYGDDGPLGTQASVR
jgi:hypothetical protein